MLGGAVVSGGPPEDKAGRCAGGPPNLGFRRTLNPKSWGDVRAIADAVGDVGALCELEARVAAQAAAGDEAAIHADHGRGPWRRRRRESRRQLRGRLWWLVTDGPPNLDIRLRDYT